MAYHILTTLFAPLYFYIIGNVIYKSDKNKFTHIIEKCIDGCIIISLIAVMLNFVISLNQSNTSIIFILFLAIFLIKKENYVNFKLRNLSFLLFLGLIISLFLLGSKVYTPDAQLYHLPFIRIINEEKIIIGLSNLHSRFGHISILQYLSAVSNNHFFGVQGINISIATFSVLIIAFFFTEFFETKNKIAKFFLLSIIIYISWKINRFSEYGNDAPAHLLTFYLVYKIINLKHELEFEKLAFYIFFIFMIKPTLIISFLLFIIYFFNKKFEQIINYKTIIFSTFLIIWLVKNLLISGCFLYPSENTCINSLEWTNAQQTKLVNIESDAWSKGWIDQKNEKLDYQSYIKNFNWIETWSKVHLLHVLKDLLPYVIILFFLLLIIRNKSKEYDNFTDIKVDQYYYYLFIIYLCGSFLWFLKFPLYRYGYSSLIILLVTITIIINFKEINAFKKEIIYKFIIILCFFAIFSKQSFRITKKIFFQNKDLNYPQVVKFSSAKIDKFHINGTDIFYKSDGECGYDYTFCTPYNLEKKLTIKRIGSYKIFISN